MTTLNAYLAFNGNCEAAFNDYQSIFGGEFAYTGRFKDMSPGEDGKTMSAEYGEKIMHISLPISQETSLTGSDTGGGWSSRFALGKNISLSRNTDTQEESDSLYNALSESGHATMPMSNPFWASYFGMLNDKFEIN